MKQRIKQPVADFLQQIGRTGIAHHRRTRSAPDRRAGKRCRNKGWAGPMAAF